MKLWMLGVDHHRFSVAERERAAVDPDACVRALREHFPDREAAVVSTCNRTELYLTGSPARSPEPAPGNVAPIWAAHCGLDAETLAAGGETRKGLSVCEHLFRVAAGLESRLIGEAEILGQVRRAYDIACGAGTAGPALHAVFQKAIANARHARAASGLSEAGGTLGSVAVRLSRGVFESLAGKHVVCIGAGEVIEAVVRRLARQQPGRLTLVNRTPARADELAAGLRADPTLPGTVTFETAAWDRLDDACLSGDLLVSATGSPDLVLDAARMRRLARRRRGQPWLLLDLAVPRDIAPEAADLEDVYLFNIDAMQDAIDADPARAAAIAGCGEQTAVAARQCFNELQHRDVGRMIQALRHQLHELGAAEAARTARSLRSALAASPAAPDTPDSWAADSAPADAMADGVPGDDAAAAATEAERLLAEHNRRLINKILHVPLQQLKRAEGEDGDAAEPSLGFYAAALRRLFDLGRDEPPTD